MSEYRTSTIRKLAERQLRHATAQERYDQMERVEILAGGLDPGKRYGLPELARGIGGEPARRNGKTAVKGSDALHDLRLFVEELSESVDLRADDMPEPVLTLEDVSRRFNVSTKTVDRWRSRGLVSRRFLFGNRRRVGFLQSAVDRFAETHAEDVWRGSRFSQLADDERHELIERARHVAGEVGSPSEAARVLSRQLGRSPETIRYTLKQHDEQNPESAVFTSASTPLSENVKNEIYESYRRGVPVETLAQRYARSKSAVYRVINDVRVRRLFDEPIDYVPSDEFEAPDAEQRILGPEPETPKSKRLAKPPAGLPPYLASLYSVPLLTKEQEVYHFRKMNYLKFKAAKLRDQIDPAKVRSRELDRIEDLLDQAKRVRNLLIRRNLRLVVSIAKKYTRAGANFFEMVSDGNVSLMRAIDKFDYSRGFKLSTYATWAIRKNFARSIPAEHRHQDRFRTGTEEVFQFSHQQGASQYEQESTNQTHRKLLGHILQQLRERDREIIVTRYGLEEGSEPQTLEEVGKRFGVSKERIRQIEKRALNRLHEIAEEVKLDIPGI